MRFRIVINTGDVIVVPGDVYGDTVNVAERLQTLAEAGGISISTGVRDAVRGKFSVEFENRGELEVKNIPDPVGTFNVIFDPIAWTMGRDAAEQQLGAGRTRYLIAAAAILLLGGAAAGAGWYFLGKSPSQPQTVTSSPSRPRTGSAALATAPWREEFVLPLASPGAGRGPNFFEGRARAPATT